MLLFLLVVAVAQAKTVRYSNVPPRSSIATKTYDLEVPGSAPIRIIEAEPIWSPEVITTSTVTPIIGRKHKTGKQYVTTQPTHSTISEPVTHEPDTSNSYSSQALNNFLKEYTQKIKEGRKKFDINRGITTEEPINKLASIYLENDRMDDHDKLKSWGLVDMKRHKHPYDDKKGWVSLEAVPWSTSKISKWQSNHKPELKPWENPTHPQSNWNTKYSNNQIKNPLLETGDNYSGSFANNDNDYNNGYDDQYNSNENIFHDKPVANFDDFPKPNYPERPQFPSKPSYEMDLRPTKIKPEPADSWSGETPSKPSWNLRPTSLNTQQTQYNNNPNPDHWNDRNQSPVFMFGSQNYKDENRDIIIDGRPGDFPKPVQNTFQSYEPIERPVAASSNHPPNNYPQSHPLHGNGEWVLVSTTKGYQYPRSKHQRSIDVTPDSIGTRRGIRLTVLPPGNDTNVNMTTSHGGLLEVESTFETVEESQHKHSIAAASAENVHVHRPPNKKNPHKVKKPVRTQVVLNTKPRPPRPGGPNRVKRPVTTMKQTNPAPVNSNQDATAVLAAVGAGMVPATMAMMVPFVAGRKKRSVDVNLQEKNNASKVPVHLFTYVQKSYT